jgi:hypothetical protein
MRAATAEESPAMWVCIAIIITWPLALLVTIARSIAQRRINKR